MPKLDPVNLAKLESAGLINPNSGLGSLSIGAGQVNTPQLPQPVQLQFIEKDTSLPTKMGTAVSNVFDAIQQKAINQAIQQGKLTGQTVATSTHQQLLDEYYGTDKAPGIIAKSGKDFINASREWTKKYDQTIKQVAKELDPYAVTAFASNIKTLQRTETDKVNTLVREAQFKLNEKEIEATNSMMANNLADKYRQLWQQLPPISDEKALQTYFSGLNASMEAEASRRDSTAGLPAGTSKDEVWYDFAVAVGTKTSIEDIAMFRAMSESLVSEISDPDLKAKVAGLASAQVNRMAEADASTLKLQDAREAQMLANSKQAIHAAVAALPDEVSGQVYLTKLVDSGSAPSVIKYAETLLSMKNNRVYDYRSEAVLSAAQANNISPANLPDFLAQRNVKITPAQNTDYARIYGANADQAASFFNKQIGDIVKAGDGYPLDYPTQIMEKMTGKVTNSTLLANLQREWQKKVATMATKGPLSRADIETAFQEFKQTILPQLISESPEFKWTPEQSRLNESVSWFRAAHDASLQASETPYTKVVEGMATALPTLKTTAVQLKTGPVSQYDILQRLAKKIEEVPPNISASGVQIINPYRSQLVKKFLDSYAKITLSTLATTIGSVPEYYEDDVYLQATSIYKNAESSIVNSIKDKATKSSKAAGKNGKSN